MPNDRDRDRLALGAAAILPVARACELLPIADGEARAWLTDRGLIRHLAGRPVVHWGAVLAALDEPDRKPDSRPRTAPLPRVRL